MGDGTIYSTEYVLNDPDENLAAYFEDDRFRPGKVFELGCGPVRNAIYLAARGCTVDYFRFSSESNQWVIRFTLVKPK
ncbi:hypothetical protein [Paenibacillus sp.]|uniref:hypothetical protein n=1 Tax=Paenibacillus sp. TaxID=58172 RepID=UPI0039C95D8F